MKISAHKIQIERQNLIFPRVLIINHGETCNDLWDEARFYFCFVIANRQVLSSYFRSNRVKNSYFFFHRLGLFRNRIETEGWWRWWLNLFWHLVIFPDICLSRRGSRSFPVLYVCYEILNWHLGSLCDLRLFYLLTRFMTGWFLFMLFFFLSGIRGWNILSNLLYLDICRYTSVVLLFNVNLWRQYCSGKTLKCYK